MYAKDGNPWKRETFWGQFWPLLKQETKKWLDSKTTIVNGLQSLAYTVKAIQTIITMKKLFVWSIKKIHFRPLILLCHYSCEKK